jgi:hypothetical protein
MWTHRQTNNATSPTSPMSPVSELGGTPVIQQAPPVVELPAELPASNPVQHYNPDYLRPPAGDGLPYPDQGRTYVAYSPHNAQSQNGAPADRTNVQNTSRPISANSERYYARQSSPGLLGTPSFVDRHGGQDGFDGSNRLSAVSSLTPSEQAQSNTDHFAMSPNMVSAPGAVSRTGVGRQPGLRPVQEG